jgi:hypothetical protein
MIIWINVDLLRGNKKKRKILGVVGEWCHIQIDLVSWVDPRIPSENSMSHSNFLLNPLTSSFYSLQPSLTHKPPFVSNSILVHSHPQKPHLNLFLHQKPSISFRVHKKLHRTFSFSPSSTCFPIFTLRRLKSTSTHVVLLKAIFELYFLRSGKAFFSNIVLMDVLNFKVRGAHLGDTWKHSINTWKSTKFQVSCDSSFRTSRTF